jgi:hypothetical protein
MCKKLELQNVTNIQIKLSSAQNKFVTINNIVAINSDIYFSTANRNYGSNIFGPNPVESSFTNCNIFMSGKNFDISEIINKFKNIFNSHFYFQTANPI